MRSVFAVTDACAGCGACIRTCPEKAIHPAPKGYGSPLVVLADRCSGCAECAEVCPVSACVEVAATPEGRENAEESDRHGWPPGAAPEVLDPETVRRTAPPDSRRPKKGDDA